MASITLNSLSCKNGAKLKFCKDFTFSIFFFCFRYSTEELTLESYGDSETESDDEDVDLENLDSVSIVAARASSSSSASSNGSTTVRVIRAHGASPSLDSGRGDSPESSCNSTLVLTPPTNAQSN